MAISKARQSKTSQLAERLVGAKRLTAEMIQEFPEILVRGRLQQIQQNMQIFNGLLAEKTESWWPQEYPFVPENKRCHYWIWGPTNTGKTTMVGEWIASGARVFWGPCNNDWIGYDDQAYDIVVFDGYKGELTIQQLERLCDPYTSLNIKGGSYLKKKKLMVVVLANYNIDQVYKGALEKDSEATAPLHVRFRQINRLPSLK